MLESDKLPNVLRCAIIFREHTLNVVPGSSLDRITVPYHFAYSKAIITVTQFAQKGVVSSALTILSVSLYSVAT